MSKAIDWEAIECAYRAGILSLRQIGTAHDVTEGAIRKRAKRDGWTRDLSEKIAAKAEDLVRKDAVRTSVRSELPNEREVVEANALMQADIIRAHRKDITRSRSLAMSLLGELEQTTTNLDLFEQLGEILYAPDKNGQDKRNEIYNKVISMASRIDGVKKLAETLKVLIGLERQAFGLKDDADGDKPTDGIRKLLKEIDGSTASLLPE
jgi:hypothetical protein